MPTMHAYNDTRNDTVWAAYHALSPSMAVSLWLFAKNHHPISQKHSDGMVGLGIFTPRNVSTAYNELSPLGVAVVSLIARLL